jgi:hypothetical protein
VEVCFGQPIAVQDYLQGQNNPEAFKSGAQALTHDLQNSLTAMVERRQGALEPMTSVF